MQYIKFQAGCLLILLYVIILYLWESTRRKTKSNRFFDIMLCVSPWAIFFDGATCYTVNTPGFEGTTINTVLHLLFYIFENAVISISFLYMHEITTGLPRKKLYKYIFALPFTITTMLIILFMDRTYYVHGSITNYSMGPSVYLCYGSLVVQFTLILILVLVKHKTITARKKFGFMSFLVIIAICLVLQLIYPQVLISAIFPLMMVLGIYINYEDPYLKSIQVQAAHMVTGFATIAESRDHNTGEHIRRTSEYVAVLLNEMVHDKKYKSILTRDYINQMIEAAPLHDIGKVSTPDFILKKPGKLTEAEFSVMMLHAENGGEIILDTFDRIEDKEFTRIAYEVARHHHEKWDGTGYPEGLKGEEIPLHARVMALADVFDALSEDRIYRPALPLPECFKIIEEGAGTSFDPKLVELFLAARPQIEKIYRG